MSSTSSINSLLSSTTTNSAIDISNILASVAGATTPGIDVTAAVAAGIAADRAPETQWNADIATFTSQTTALTAMQTATEALATDMQSLNTLSGPLAARTVTSSNSNDLTASAATGTAPGMHTVVVNNVATTGSWYSDLETSPTSALPASSMTITTTAGATATFPTGTGVTGGDNLNDLATAINTANLGVNATVVSDASGSRLAIISNTSGAAGGFSVTSSNFSGTSWTSPDIPTGAALGANSITLTSSAGTATIATTSGETYAQLATAINAATVSGPAVSYGSQQTGLSGSTLLTPGSVTTIQDTGTGNTFSYTAQTGDTVDTLNAAIATAVGAGTLSANVTGSVASGAEVVSEQSTDQGITVSTNDAVLGAMTAAVNNVPLGLTATAGSDTNGTNLTIASSGSSTFTLNEPAFGFTQAAAATNASLTVDGVPVQSATNQVTGAIPGVTLTLLAASSGSPVDITVAPDATQISTAINQFVTDYNTALNLVNTQFKDTSSTDSSGNTTTGQGVLASDPIVVQLQGVLEQAAAYSYTPASGTTTVSTLSDLGITTNDDGSLSVDSTTLNNALANNASDVTTFLQGSALNGFANSVYNAVETFTNPANGAFQVDLSSIASESASVTSEINDFETGYIAAQQKILTADYTQAEEALQALPTEMEQLNAELGLTPTGNNNG